MGVWLSFFYKFAENKEFLIGRFLPYKLGIETPAPGSWSVIFLREPHKMRFFWTSRNIHLWVILEFF